MICLLIRARHCYQDMKYKFFHHGPRHQRKLPWFSQGHWTIYTPIKINHQIKTTYTWQVRDVSTMEQLKKNVWKSWVRKGWLRLFVCLMVFNATVNNISVISWRPALLVEEAGVPRKNHRPCASNWHTLSLVAANWVHLFFVIYKAGCKPMPYW